MDNTKDFRNEQNNKQVNGMLVIEIIPKDQGSATVKIPKIGDLIEVYGAWVTDTLMDGMKYIQHGKFGSYKSRVNFFKNIKTEFIYFVLNPFLLCLIV